MSTGKDPLATGRIRIIRAPLGEAPQTVRDAWVGLELPCHPYVGPSTEGLDRGVLTEETVARNSSGFSVPQEEAIAILEDQRPVAASWWRAQGFPHRGGFFGFDENCAEILSGVTQMTIRCVDELDHPRR